MLLLLALCILLTSVNALFQAHTPLGLIECQISELSWEGAEGQVQVLVFPGGIESGSPLENLPTVAQGIDSVAWLVDQPAGVEYTFVMIDLTTGQVAPTAPSLVGANPSGDTSCERKNGQSMTATLEGILGGSTQSHRPAVGTVPVTSPDPGVLTATPITTATTTTSSIPDPGTSSATSLHDTTTTMTSIHTPGASTATGDILPLKHTSIAGPVAGTVVGLIVVATAISVLLCIRRRRRDRSLPHTPEDVAPMVGMMAAPSPLTTRTTSNTQIMSNQYTAMTQQPPPHPREPIRSPATSTGKRQLVVMSAADDEPLAPTSQQLATLGEENAMLRAVIARMQTSLLGNFAFIRLPLNILVVKYCNLCV